MKEMFRLPHHLLRLKSPSVSVTLCGMDCTTTHILVYPPLGRGWAGSGHRGQKESRGGGTRRDKWTGSVASTARHDAPHAARCALGTTPHRRTPSARAAVAPPRTLLLPAPASTTSHCARCCSTSTRLITRTRIRAPACALSCLPRLRSLPRAARCRALPALRCCAHTAALHPPAAAAAHAPHLPHIPRTLLLHAACALSRFSPRRAAPLLPACRAHRCLPFARVTHCIFHRATAATLSRTTALFLCHHCRASAENNHVSAFSSDMDATCTVTILI